MRIDFADERVLAVVAHPDDAELLCAGTLWRARQDGAMIGICIVCQGDKGQPPPPKGVHDLAGVRAREAEAAAKLLGADLHRLGIGDSELADNYETRKRLIEVFRLFNPTLVLAHSLNDYHADHRAAGALTEAVSWGCTSLGIVTRSSRVLQPPALWWMDTLGMHGFEPSFYIDVTPAVEIKRQMLECHESQISRRGDKAFVPLADLMLHQYVARGEQAGVGAAEAFRIHPAMKRVRAF